MKLYLQEEIQKKPGWLKNYVANQKLLAWNLKTEKCLDQKLNLLTIAQDSFE